MFASMIKSSLKCIQIYVTDVSSGRKKETTFSGQKLIGRIRVKRQNTNHATFTTEINTMVLHSNEKGSERGYI